MLSVQCLVLSVQCLVTPTRYNGSLAALREAVGGEARRALFLERIEKWTRAVGHFEQLSHPVRLVRVSQPSPTHPYPYPYPCPCPCPCP